ncbi:hypothetical protein C8A05DRAFT_31495 [Staphylotrichum tortipilum]|uniref:DUF726-domain-containing protein n=1 Tax=Staphylotrichum tortipilum TaxID=2831512 RepID=A0AAN6RVW9_9PEZI|nr:hypothetical protein C8A05DRAFT_31495 [Staphylotrichum longicolle]
MPAVDGASAGSAPDAPSRDPPPPAALPPDAPKAATKAAPSTSPSTPSPAPTTSTTTSTTTSAPADNGPSAPPPPADTPTNANKPIQPKPAAAGMPAEVDEFGLPLRKYQPPPEAGEGEGDGPSAATTEGGVVDAPRQPDKDGGAVTPSGDGGKQEKADPAAAAQKPDLSKRQSTGAPVVSEFSHQQLTAAPADNKDDDDAGWQVMPSYAPYDIYDDDNKLVAKEYNEDADEPDVYVGLGGAGKGYTKVMLDDDAESATSMDEHTQYLFKDAGGGTSTGVMDDDDSQRDAVSQLQATKELLTEGQRIAYVGLTRLELSAMLKEAESIKYTSKSKKHVTLAAENMKMWSQKMMIRLYTHMDISPAEQVMIEQLSAHGVMPQDLTPVLMANARVRNPMAAADADTATADRKTSTSSPGPSRPTSVASPLTEQAAEPPPPYSAHDDSELTAPVRTPSQMPTTDKIDIDIRWTVLCDLFLVLIADSIYDARSRLLLERVAQDLDISWLDICRFEKKVTDALEMQANAERENWDESEHMENRRKLALKRRYVMMGLATVGGGLVIGLSAGLLAPVIGLGLAAGFTTIGIGGTGGFLAGAGGAAIITSSAAASGSFIGVRAANRRTGAVKTFEYRPLNNNKRVNLIVTVSGWMTGKVDDVRLPFSTVDPVMGDIYSVLWEPEMLTSMGDTINILATEALTQGLQQVLGSTVLITLMAALQVPVVLTKLAYLIDNPWAVSLDRATMAGLILADSLIDRNLGTRPVTLVGYSLGSRVIFSCLQELAKKGAVGLVQNVYLFGSPVVVKKDEYLRARTVVSGRFVNGYNRNDWILGYLFRLTNGGIRRIAGLAPIEEIPGLENKDVSEFVIGHMDYRTAMPRLMRECGWLVESDEFTEIEDPDPDNYQERQRELINEIEEARRELEKEGKGSKGGAFGFFKRKKAPEKQEWEVYEEKGKAVGGGKTEDKEGNNHGVLFDVDAIRAEIARESKGDKNIDVDDELLQVREIKSTLPPIKLELNPPAAAKSPNPSTGLTPPVKPLRETKSAEVFPPQYSPMAGTPPLQSETRSSHDPAINRERTPTFSESGRAGSSSPYHTFGHGHSYSSGYGYGGHHGAEEDEISMTFDTGFHDHKPEPSPFARSAGAGAGSRSPFSGEPSPSPSPFAAPPGGASASGGGGKAAAGGEPASPEVNRTGQRVGGITLADPWADDEDEEFGKEKEIEMTFA